MLGRFFVPAADFTVVLEVDSMPKAPAEMRLLKSQMFGRKVRWPYSEHWFAYSVFTLRIALGWVMLWAGIDKIIEPLRGNPRWTASGFLNFAIPEGNPFRQVFVAMDSAAIDYLVMWGLLLVGLSLILGVLTRFAAFWGFVMMTFFWLAAWEGWFKLEHGWVVDEHVIYMLLFFGLGAFGAGRILGIDRWIEQQPWFKRHQWLAWLMG